MLFKIIRKLLGIIWIIVYFIKIIGEWDKVGNKNTNFFIFHNIQFSSVQSVISDYLSFIIVHQSKSTKDI